MPVNDLGDEAAAAIFVGKDFVNDVREQGGDLVSDTQLSLSSLIVC